MILVSYYDPENVLRTGVRVGEGIVRTGLAAADVAARGLDALPELTRMAGDGEASTDPAGLRLGPPVPHPGKILCVGLNYRKHARETGMAIPTSPVLFSKFDNAVAGPDAAVVAPPEVERLDYEAELVVVIGRRARRVSRAHALDHVLGYTNGNDLSARDLQQRTSQWLLGKTLDGFLPMGPQLVTADAIPDPQALPVRGWLNGELRQDSTTADMIFGVAEIVSYASTYVTLEPGDVIATGTPEGVILGMEEQRWMRPGDVYTVEIGPLGRLTTRIVAP
ncbi:MAG TPA: fumarylacetoacetate hydrolase family protein [Trueperaceae bacterium]|nr:fumarylacetoacetate hydrolase family protein [Trueperaceae bacterium]